MKVFKVKKKDSSRIVELDLRGFESFFSVQYLQHLVLETRPKRLPLLYRFGPLKKDAVLLYEKHQDKILDGFVASCSIRWLDQRIGYGLFAEKNFREGDFIGEYCGVLKKHNDKNEYCLLYPRAFPFFETLMIDAKEKGNEMRFINHSFVPNLVIQPVLDNNLIHMIFIAGKKIGRGEQLTYDYGDDFWSSRPPPLDL